MTTPDLESVGELVRGLLADLPRRWLHTSGVERRARLITRILAPEDGKLLLSAALLHDVGYSARLVRTGFHSLDGARWLTEQNFSRRLCALVAHHSCAYVEAELRGLSAQLEEWYDECTPLRDALWWADMTTGPDGKPTTVGDRIAEIQERYGPEDLVAFSIQQAEPELVAAVERTEARLRAAGVEVR